MLQVTVEGVIKERGYSLVLPSPLMLDFWYGPGINRSNDTKAGFLRGYLLSWGRD